MRTTLTLDDDVVAALERLRQRGDASFRELVNEALRTGLNQMTARPKRQPVFQTRVVSLGGSRFASMDNIDDVLAVTEGEFLLP